LKRLTILTITLLALLPLGIAQMQDTATPTLEITGINATGLPEVIVTANVLDNLGQPVSGLTVEHFNLLGDLTNLGTITNVENITDDNLAFASVLIIDTSSSMDGSPILNAQEAARQYVEALGPDDPVSIITFDTTARVVQDYTTDKDLLLNTIDNLRYGGKTALYDAALLAVQQAAAAPLPRRAAVLLSDSAEFGGVSNAARAAALEEAQVRGVPPIYTIGLGFGTDRSYLQQLANGTNARYFESPTPEQLVDIYSELAATFRSQYVITLNLDVPADGTEYALGLSADTDFGATNEATTTLRAPILRPIITLPEGIFAEPISEPVTVAPEIAADDDITSLTFTVADGEPIAAESVTIDPATIDPGTYTLGIQAEDSTGDVTDFAADFTIPALPSVVTLDFPDSDAPITTPQEVIVNATGQTEATEVTFSVNSEVVAADEEAPFSYTIDPGTLAPGSYELGVTVLNRGGALSEIVQPFTVGALPPLVAISGIEENAVIAEPVDIIVNTGGQTEVTSVTFDPGTGETADAAVDESGAAVITVDPVALGDGTYAGEITVTNAGGVTETVFVPFTVLLPTPTPTATFTPTNTTIPTDEASDTPTDEPTDEASDTPTDEPTDEASDTPTDEPADEASDTPTDEPTAMATPTEEPTVDEAATEVAMANIQATDDAAATLTAEADEQATIDAQATADAEATANAAATSTGEAGSTMTAEFAEQEMENADATETAIVAEQATLDAAATLDAEMDATQTTEAEADEATEDAATADAATEVAAAAAEDETEEAAVQTEEPTDDVTEEPTAEDPTPTQEVVAETDTAITAEAAAADETEVVPTLTPIGELEEVEGDQPVPEEGNNNLLLFGGIGLVLLLIVLFLLFGRRGNRQS